MNLLNILFVCFECLRFRLRLSWSVNGQMTCIQLNCHSSAQKFSCFFYWKQLNGNLARYFKIKSICVFECEWPNGNSNDLCTAKLPFGRSHSNSNANGNWGIQNALLFWYSSKDTHFRSLMPNSSCQIHHKEPCIDYLPSPLDLGRCNSLWYKWQLWNPGRLSQSAQ